MREAAFESEDVHEEEEFDSRSPADALLDDLIPPDFDWRGMVRRHPIPAVAVAAAAGFWLGRSRRASGLVDALAGFITAGVVSRLGGSGQEVDEDPFEGRDPLTDGDDLF